MYYQANAAKQLDMFKETMQGDNAQAAMLDFVRENPPDAKFRRKKNICWVAFHEKYGRRISDGTSTMK